jgi:hypothetical protein
MIPARLIPGENEPFHQKDRRVDRQALPPDIAGPGSNGDEDTHADHYADGEPKQSEGRSFPPPRRDRPPKSQTHPAARGVEDQIDRNMNAQ